jgi:deoxyribodipyrimidine photo-lyase
MTNKGLFIFRRDLRYQDNIGLYNACKECDEVFCLFILTPAQIQPKQNNYFSYNAFAFMLESLIELKKEINLHIEYGQPHDIIKKIANENKIDCVYFNRDYTPYSIQRDQLICELLKKNNINSKKYDDIPLNSPDKIKPYKVFTPYYNAAKVYKISSAVKPDISKIKNIKIKNKSVDIQKMLSNINNKTAEQRQHGGRKLAEETLKKAIKTQKEYAKNRDDLTQETTRLSPYIKFGVLGIREIYRNTTNKTLAKELYWRDFYIQVAYHFPNVLIDNNKIPLKTGTYDIDKNFKPTKVKWEFNKKLYKAFITGKTGIPIVDAAVRQLLLTGYMHNRCRMITASVFTKLFHLDWRLGEKFFANNLTDYDPCSNNGGWQWSSSTGADSQPYFRIFNPYTQPKKHDPECKYIKKWCPELANLSPKEIFNMRSELFNYELEHRRAIDLFKKS